MRHRIKAADIASWCHSPLQPEELIVHTLRLDWGNGEEYPLDKMAFYEADKPDEVCTLHHNKNETSQYRPQQCYEYRVRVFVKSVEVKARAK